MTITGTEYVDYERLSRLTALRDAVIEAATAWDMGYSARASSLPVDDELHFAVQALISARAEQNDTKLLTCILMRRYSPRCEYPRKQSSNC